MKSQITLLPPKGILAAAEVMTLANTPNKHLDEKWRTMTPATHVDAALRHLYAWLSGESRDPELGTSHLANASVRLLMASERELDERERIANTCPPWDDRARYTHVKEAPLPAPANPEWEAYVDGTLNKLGDEHSNTPLPIGIGKTLDELTGQEWNAANQAYLMGRNAALARYDTAVSGQRAGDDE